MNRHRKQLYFLRPEGARGPVKIGSSERPTARLRDYQIWSPVRLEMAAVIPAHHNAETFLHRHFLDTWMHGEWFAWGEELQELIDHINQHEALPIWVQPPTNPGEYRAFIEKYPRGKPKESRRALLTRRAA